MAVALKDEHIRLFISGASKVMWLTVDMTLDAPKINNRMCFIWVAAQMAKQNGFKTWSQIVSFENYTEFLRKRIILHFAKPQSNPRAMLNDEKNSDA